MPTPFLRCDPVTWTRSTTTTGAVASRPRSTTENDAKPTMSDPTRATTNRYVGRPPASTTASDSTMRSRTRSPMSRPDGTARAPVPCPVASSSRNSAHRGERDSTSAGVALRTSTGPRCTSGPPQTFGHEAGVRDAAPRHDLPVAPGRTLCRHPAGPARPPHKNLPKNRSPDERSRAASPREPPFSLQPPPEQPHGVTHRAQGPTDSHPACNARSGRAEWDSRSLRESWPHATPSPPRTAREGRAKRRPPPEHRDGRAGQYAEAERPRGRSVAPATKEPGSPSPRCGATQRTGHPPLEQRRQGREAEAAATRGARSERRAWSGKELVTAEVGADDLVVLAPVRCAGPSSLSTPDSST